jgi:hypothetical protein
MREIEHAKDHVWMRSSIAEEEAVDHERKIGTVPATNDEILVRVAQRVDYDLLAEPIGCRVSAPRITVGGMFEITAQQARDLAEYLIEAADFVETRAGSSERPRLVARG